MLSRRHIIKSLKAEADQKRKPSEKLADFFCAVFGNVSFLIVNVMWFALWILANQNLIPGIPAFDPYPFGLLTMIVSLEAIVLAIVVLISQNRSARVDDLREEVDLQVDMITETELTKLMQMVNELLKKNGIDTSRDHELQEMLQPTNLQKIKKILEREVEEI